MVAIAGINRKIKLVIPATMLPVFITTLAIEISSIVIIAAFFLFEDDV